MTKLCLLNIILFIYLFYFSFLGGESVTPDNFMEWLTLAHYVGLGAYQTHQPWPKMLGALPHSPSRG
jgi:hypothetical protein